MGCEVYANGMSIACKAADGKTMAMPDVCLSPPTPPAGPVPIPYPNMAMASDTTKGSKTVQIGGQEVMLKNKSTFKKSTGDEAATKSLGMGVVSHQITGEVNFCAWSMDVKFEGENIPRHLDLTLHNEMCNPANTPPGPYVSKMSPPKPPPPCSPHSWVIEYPKNQTPTAGDKKAALRATGDLADEAEAAAADHNNVTDGKDMSGVDDDTSLFQVCTNCKMRCELDHVNRDPSGKIVSIVEVKSGNCNIDAPQLLRQMELAKSMGASVVAKLKGHGAALGKKFIETRPFLSGVTAIIVP